MNYCYICIRLLKLDLNNNNNRHLSCLSLKYKNNLVYTTLLSYDNKMMFRNKLLYHKNLWTYGLCIDDIFYWYHKNNKWLKWNKYYDRNYTNEYIGYVIKYLIKIQKFYRKYKLNKSYIHNYDISIELKFSQPTKSLKLGGIEYQIGFKSFYDWNK